MPLSAIAERFRETCRAHASSPAVVGLSHGGVTTFAELWAQHATVRQALIRFGIGPGTCVVSHLSNRPLFFSVFVACLDVGAALIPLGDATDAEVAALVHRAGAAAIATDRALPLAGSGEVDLADGARLIRVVQKTDAVVYGRSRILKLTSGSTDLPRAAMASEDNLIGDSLGLIHSMGIEAADCNLTMIPLSHAYTIGNVVMPLILQGTRVALRTSFSPAEWIRDVQVSGATIFPGVPFMFEHLRGAALQSERVPTSLRLMITAGARIDASTMRWFAERAGRKIHSLYGTSETGGITYDDSDEVEDPLHVGTPLPGVSIEIRAEPGVTGAGRIFVRGPGVASGYAATSDAEAASAFHDGGFLTGDLGYVNNAGRLVLSGRVSPLINVAGRKVDPTEIERVLIGLPGVTDARVLGVPCDKRGQELVAFVVRTTGTMVPIVIRQLCAGILSPYKIPRRFIFLERMPVDARGKVDRRSLEALISDRRPT